MFYKGLKDAHGGAMVMVALNEDTFKACKSWCDHEITECLFRDTVSQNTVYLLAHGRVTDAKFSINGNFMDSKEWLVRNANSLIAQGITDVYTICCFGGRQDSWSFKGVTIRPLFETMFQYYVTANVDCSYCVPTKNGDKLLEHQYGLTVSSDNPSDGPFMRAYKHLWDKLFRPFARGTTNRPTYLKEVKPEGGEKNVA